MRRANFPGMSNTTPDVAEFVRLSEAAPSLSVPSDGRPYVVQLPLTKAIVLRFGQKYASPAATFAHPKLLARVHVVHEFKHYRGNGSKFWTARAGVDLYFAVPVDRVEIKRAKGYSYVAARCNGVELVFNVSGGTEGNGWSDFVRPVVEVSVGHTIADLRKIAEVALSPAELRAQGWSWAQQEEPYTDTPARERAFRRIQLDRWLKANAVPGMKVVIDSAVTLCGGETLSFDSFGDTRATMCARGSVGLVRFKTGNLDVAATIAAAGAQIETPNMLPMRFTPPVCVAAA